MTKIAVIAPRNMKFSPIGATSIDLCIHDLTTKSRYRDDITVYTLPVEQPFDDIATRVIQKRRWEPPAIWALRLARRLQKFKPDLIEVHQHLPTAAILAQQFEHIPVTLHRHGFLKTKKGKVGGWRKSRQFGGLAKIIFVSEASLEDFQKNWPDLADKGATIPNGIDLGRGPNFSHKENTIFFAGRMAQEKGVLELAQALAKTLPEFPDWRATIISANVDKEPDYFRRVKEALGPVESQILLLTDMPHHKVMEHAIRSSIAVVPSLVREAFGRAALEAHAAGTAVISSGTGALREVSDGAALYLDYVDAETIGDALKKLIQNPELRSELQQKGLFRAQNFDIRNSVEKLDNLRDELMGIKNTDVNAA